MIISQIENTNNYLIKIIHQNIDIYDPQELEETTKKIFGKINKKNKLSNHIKLEFYYDEHYGIIIYLNNNNNNNDLNSNNEVEVKITIHIDTPFLYKMDYFDIQNNNSNIKNIYYYHENFYIAIKNEIDSKEYLKILELSEAIYEDSHTIINEGIEVKI